MFSRSKTQYQKSSVTSVRNAYMQLMNFQPQNDIDKIMKNYFIENLPPTLKNYGAVFVLDDEINAKNDIVNIDNKIEMKENVFEYDVKFNQISPVGNIVNGEEKINDEWNLREKILLRKLGI